MKKLAILFISVLALACHKDDPDPVLPPVLQLPAATQYGANTFGCLLDGQVFVPGGGANPLDCVYQYSDGGYYFTLQANRRIEGNLIRLGCNTQKLEIAENNTYLLQDVNDGNASGKYFFGIAFYYTSTIHSGELKITKLDQDFGIVSGTFWYDVDDDKGVVHQIREGRFDMQYTN